MARKYQMDQKPRGGSSGIDYEAELNVQQYAAVSSPPGRLSSSRVLDLEKRGR